MYCTLIQTKNLKGRKDENLIFRTWMNIFKIINQLGELLNTNATAPKMFVSSCIIQIVSDRNHFTRLLFAQLTMHEVILTAENSLFKTCTCNRW